MHARAYWTAEIERLWAERNVLWVAGVRRSGKTTLCRGLADVDYLDCELPRERRRLSDPEGFLEEHRGRRIVLDEIHRLDAPAELLKIAADHFRDTRLLATGSSSLGASRHFRDTLAGRKRTLWLSPMIHVDGLAFGQPSIAHRMHRGGLPPFFTAARYPDADYREWIDGYWAKDLQELFRLERRHSFEKLLELLFQQSGGMFDATSLAGPCGVSRPTVQNYVSALEETFVMHVLRPFHSGRSQEIIQAPKVYGFDTGFLAWFRGWTTLRQDDYGTLWEHLVLNELFGTLQTRDIGYWRDKSRHEIDFVLALDRAAPTAIEAKWSADAFDARGLGAFRAVYPNGDNLVVAHDVGKPYQRRFDGHLVRFIGLADVRTLSVRRTRAVSR